MFKGTKHAFLKANIKSRTIKTALKSRHWPASGLLEVQKPLGKFFGSVFRCWYVTCSHQGRVTRYFSWFFFLCLHGALKFTTNKNLSAYKFTTNKNLSISLQFLRIPAYYSKAVSSSPVTPAPPDFQIPDKRQDIPLSVQLNPTPGSPR